jgi:hypothetical protein
VFSGVFTAKEVDGLWDYRTGVTITVDISTLLVAFVNMSPISAHCTAKAFSLVKSKTFGLGTTARLSGFLNYQITD